MICMVGGKIAVVISSREKTMSLLLFLQLNVTPDVVKLLRFRASVPRMNDCSWLNGEHCSCMRCHCSSLRLRCIPNASQQEDEFCLVSETVQQELLKSKPWSQLTQFYAPLYMWLPAKTAVRPSLVSWHDKNSVTVRNLFQTLLHE